MSTRQTWPEIRLRNSWAVPQEKLLDRAVRVPDNPKMLSSQSQAITSSAFPEWIKILLSATAGVLVGFVSAFILEPLKRRVEEKRVTKIATRAVYDELAAVYEILAASIALPDVANGSLFPLLPFDQFDYYYNHKRETFYRIPEWLTLVALVRECRRTQDEVKQGKRTGHSAVTGMLDSINIRKNADTDFRHLLDEGRGNFQSYAKTYEKPYWDWFQAMKSRSARL